MCGGEQKYQDDKDDGEDEEGLFTRVYDWFGWHGKGPLLVLVMFVFCLVCGFYTFKTYVWTKDLNIKQHRITSVTLDADKHLVEIDGVSYKGVCALDSVDFNKKNDICNYYCWWHGDIGNSARYRMVLPCKTKSQ